jgi:hypothetical protein
LKEKTTQILVGEIISEKIWEGVGNYKGECSA